MVQKEFRVANFEKGRYLTWHVASQSKKELKVTLRDDQQDYFASKKNKGNSNLEELAFGGSHIKGNDLTIVIDIPESDEIKGTPYLNTTLKENGDLVGYTWLLTIEEAHDDDYNDLTIVLSSMRLNFDQIWE